MRFHLYNNNSVATFIQEFPWENLEQPNKLNRRCSKCEFGQDQEATETRSISEFPTVLFVHVPKFEIKIKSKISDKFLTIGNERYELCAVMDRQGATPNSGHWIVWSKNRDNSGWLKCINDKDITDVLQKVKLFSQENFLFAYLRLDQIQILNIILLPTSPSSVESSKSQKNISPKASTNEMIEVRCQGCFKQFKALMKHLSKSKTCQEFYDMDALSYENKKKRQENTKKRVKRFRANETPEKNLRRRKKQ